ncbi:photosystem I reaction center subunit IX [Pantanalinema sp. GBBB05]|nr:photosystem I reaction center subunit IX [Pantanalinema sp. GBBB05]
MRHFFRYLTSAPVMATVVVFILAGVLIELNRFFPGLQYGTYFHGVP